MATPDSLSLNARYVHGHARDRFLHALFVRPQAREAVFTLYALEAELAHVHTAVSEEMIAYIRFAWWYEALEALYNRQVRRGQPVIEALALLVEAGHLPQLLLLAIVEDYRYAYPELPASGPQHVDVAVAALLEALSPESITAWRKAGKRIAAHRARYGTKANAWLVLKLWVGL